MPFNHIHITIDINKLSISILELLLYFSACFQFEITSFLPPGLIVLSSIKNVFDKKMLSTEIEAVKFILECFYDHSENENERNKLIKEKVKENPNIKTYARFSEALLQNQLQIFHSKLPVGE